MLAEDGLNGAADRGPFDVIAVTGALCRRSPTLEAQLAVGGRLFAVIGQGPAMEAMLVDPRPPPARLAEPLSRYDEPPPLRLRRP